MEFLRGEGAISPSFSALQRAEIAEIIGTFWISSDSKSFSALQRAEIAEILTIYRAFAGGVVVSVLFNEPKLLKSRRPRGRYNRGYSFSALQRAEIAEIVGICGSTRLLKRFQCSSTSRNC